MPFPYLPNLRFSQSLLSHHSTIQINFPLHQQAQNRWSRNNDSFEDDETLVYEQNSEEADQQGDHFQQQPMYYSRLPVFQAQIHMSSSQEQHLSDSQDNSSQHESSSQEESQEESQASAYFFQKEEGLSEEEVRRFPLMNWGAMHDKFNKGQKCSICLEEFCLGDTLRVMSCLHRYHSCCLDDWLLRLASCPNCRHPVRPL